MLYQHILNQWQSNIQLIWINKIDWRDEKFIVIIIIIIIYYLINWYSDGFASLLLNEYSWAIYE